MAGSELWTVKVGESPTSALLDRPAGAACDTVIILGHGASTRKDSRTMENLAGALLPAGVCVVRFNFLYTEQHRNPPDRMPRLMECFASVVDHARRELAPKHVVIGGHSMGGRAASHLAADGAECDGLLLFSYPLHPAGQPEKLRVEHLPSITKPVLCLNGTRDDLCRQDIMAAILPTLSPRWTMHWIEGADHSYHVQKRSGRTDEEVISEISGVSARWLATLEPVKE